MAARQPPRPAARPLTGPPPPGRRARPTRADLEAARDLVVPDLVADDLDVLLCGINPGLWTAWSGHHFGRPGNRFWAALHLAGLTPRLLRPDEQDQLPGMGIGITNVVPRTTAAASELTPQEIRAGGERLAALVARVRPGVVVVLGVGAYRTAFGHPRATLGRQPEPLAGVPVWVAPNPSGLQARYGVEEIAALLRDAARDGAARRAAGT